MTTDAKKDGFKVTDRRAFADGEGKNEAGPAGAPGDEAPPAGNRAPKSPDTGGEAGTLPAVDFHTFLLSLGSSALLHLGELEHPETGQAERDLPLAKQTIDILSMLGEKTKGNLTPAEDKLMASLLYDLRLRFVSASKK